ncbi:MAG: GDP-mannose 4,6-dehydratase [Pseudomonadota bacterium]
MKTALITGITGQDGAYLARLLLDKGYRVYGTSRKSEPEGRWRLVETGVLGNDSLRFCEHDITDFSSNLRLLEACEPDEIYNLAAQSYVGLSFKQPLVTGAVNGLGPVCLLEAIRILNPQTKFYQASTSEMFGKAEDSPHNELGPFFPHNPYGAAKLYAHFMTINYANAHSIFASSGILFNHESPLRSKSFVTRKITDSVARIRLGKMDCLELGNLDVYRDWGYAKEYVAGMWKILQAPTPGTYVLSTGRPKTVRDFARLSFSSVGIELDWVGDGLNEVAKDRHTGKTVIRINPQFFRPTESERQVGDADKALRELGWKAETTLEQLCSLMVEADIRRCEKEA